VAFVSQPHHAAGVQSGNLSQRIWEGRQDIGDLIRQDMPRNERSRFHGIIFGHEVCSLGRLRAIVRHYDQNDVPLHRTVCVAHCCLPATLPPRGARRQGALGQGASPDRDAWPAAARRSRGKRPIDQEDASQGWQQKESPS